MAAPLDDRQPELNDLQTYFVREFVQEYKDGHMSRRDMMRRVLYITGGVVSTAALLTGLGCTPATPATPTSAAPATSSGAAPQATTASTSASPTTAASSPTVASSPPASPAASPASAAASPTASTGTSTGASPVASPVAAASPAASPSAGGARSPVSVAANDPAVQATNVTFPGGGATLMGYQARPSSASGPTPVVLICHENRGLTEHIRDVARRYAKEGYFALAVDLLSREGGTDRVADPAQIPAILSSPQNAPRHVEDFKAAVEYAKTQGSLARADRIGMVGYCFGGGITWRAVEAIPDLRAASPYYGPPPPLDQVPNIKAAVFAIYSSDPNDFANNGRDQLEAALRAASVTHEFKVYPGTNHAFHNDTGASWNQEQALAAYRDTLAWFERYLKT